MYTDDPIFGVVGRDRALRLLSTWMRLVTEMRLKMAIHEKRHLGTWAPWLGVLLLAGLGLVLIPKAKLLRTIERINELLTHGLSFQDYRALIGMLEHLQLLVTSGGAPMTAAIRRQAEPINLGLAVIFTVTADAATDSVPPGLGGFCHGLWWHVEIPMEWLPYLHITVLELKRPPMKQPPAAALEPKQSRASSVAYGPSSASMGPTHSCHAGASR